jgi:HK97 family phage prohead protease
MTFADLTKDETSYFWDLVSRNPPGVIGMPLECVRARCSGKQVDMPRAGKLRAYNPPPETTRATPAPPAPQVRYGSLDEWASAQAELLAITIGYASVFGEEYLRDGRPEQILPGAFEDSLWPHNGINEGRLEARVGHDARKELATLDNGRLYVEEDSVGLLVAVALPFLPGADHGLLAELRDRGEVGMSIGIVNSPERYPAPRGRLARVFLREVTFCVGGEGMNPAATCILAREQCGRLLLIDQNRDCQPTVLPRGIAYRTPVHRTALERLGLLGAAIAPRRRW